MFVVGSREEFQMPTRMLSILVVLSFVAHGYCAIEFNQIGQVNPQFMVNGTTVSFGSAFVGQTLGSMGNELIDSSPEGPLRLDPNAPSVSTFFDISTMNVVLGGFQNGAFMNTPLAILFEDPVRDLTFDLGSLDAPGTVRIEAFQEDGTSLGMFSNFSAGWQTVRMADSSGHNLIAGVSIYVPEGGMDWEGFGIDNLSFSFSSDTPVDEGEPDGDPGDPGPGDPGDPGVVPEPATYAIWAGFIAVGIVGSWLKRRRE